MNCAEVEEQISAYVINELQDDELKDRIGDHIRTCKSCYAWFCEVREMAEIWSDENAAVDGLNLVDPVLRQLRTQPSEQLQYAHPQFAQSLLAKPRPEPLAVQNPQLDPQMDPQPQPQIQQRKRILQSRMVYVHYGLAASFTIALFQLGVFEHVGLHIVNNGILLSQQVEGFLRMFGAL